MTRRSKKTRDAEHEEKTSERVRLLIDLRPLEHSDAKTVEARIRNLWNGTKHIVSESAEA